MKYSEIKLVIQWADQRIDIDQVKADIEASLAFQSGYMVLGITDTPLEFSPVEMDVSGVD